LVTVYTTGDGLEDGVWYHTFLRFNGATVTVGFDDGT
jgi:hypothetical protein